MLVESSTLLWADLVVAGVLGAIFTPILIYVLQQNADRKKEATAQASSLKKEAADQATDHRKELTSAFESIRQQRDVDQKHIAEVFGEMRDKTTVLQTTVNIKKETVDGVARQQIADGLRVATLEANVTAIKESQKRTEDHQLQIIGKLDSLGRIEENVKSLTEDMREVRAEQARKSE
jgi:septal ring factor EnvC (AmiA/AmiB activator)